MDQQADIEEERRAMELEATEERTLCGSQPSPEDKAAAAMSRAEGNALFKVAEWEAALDQYKKAGRLDEREPLIELNKSAVGDARLHFLLTRRHLLPCHETMLPFLQGAAEACALRRSDSCGGQIVALERGKACKGVGELRTGLRHHD